MIGDHFRQEFIAFATEAVEISLERIEDEIELSVFNTKTNCWCKVRIHKKDALQLSSFLAQLSNGQVIPKIQPFLQDGWRP